MRYPFAGLLRYGRVSDAPDAFIFTPTASVTLFEGANGSGKTSILNAIIWCLTGYLIRSQRGPELGTIEFDCEITRPSGDVKDLPSISRLSGLSIEERQLADISRWFAQINREAAILAELADNPECARRAQLYAMVSSWIHRHEHPADGRCPVCTTVHRIIYEELVAGQIKESSRTAYRAVIARLVEAGAEAIILGCTEIMLLVRPEDSSVPIFDTTALHAEAAIEYTLKN